MHILLIHQAFVAPEESGGTRHYEFAHYCTQQNNTFTIIASNINYKTGKNVTNGSKLVTEQRVNGIQILRAYTYPSIHRSFVWRVVAFLSFMTTSIIAASRPKKVDIVMGTTPPIFQAISAWITSVIHHRPFLLEVRDLWPAFAIDIGVLRNPLLIVLSCWLEKFLYNRANHILLNSPAYRDYLIDRGISKEKITLIPNGVNPEMFDPSASGEQLRQQWDLQDKFVVTYAGALGMANDIPTILRAAQKLQEEPAIHFLLVGDGKERKNLEQQAQQMALTNVTFTGPCSKAMIPSVLAASDVCVATLKNIPMFRTTYPNKVFDYMAAGRPTILAIDGVIRKVIDASGGGIFVPPGDDHSLSIAVTSLYNHRSQVQSMGEASRSYVVKHFNRHEHAQLFLELIKNLNQRG